MQQQQPATMLFSKLEEVEADVFLKLPLKSIGKCRCVCKLWRNLLCSPRFVKHHLDSSSHNPRLMLKASISDKQDVLYSKDYASISSSALSPACKCKKVVRMHYPFECRYGGSVHILGSCNGLICLATYLYPLGIESVYSLCIWNPSTGEYKRILPNVDIKVRYRYGFGYDQSIDDYKLVRVWDDVKKPVCFQAEVHAVKSDSCTTIQSIPYSFPFCGIQFPSVLLDGALHWLGATTTRELNSEVIVCFNISNERFMDVGIPEEAMAPQIGGYSVKNLGVLRDCLCLVVHVSSLVYIVWVMQDYGAKESWTKQFTITENKIARYHFWNSKPIWFLENGEILINTLESFYLYDQENERGRELEVNFPRFVYMKHNRPQCYVESLVSLNSGTYVQQLNEL